MPPLAVPDPRVLPPLEVLTQYEAVRLFVERAKAVKPDFSVTNESAPAVAEICARLDGLPLAIELAAARVRLLSPAGDAQPPRQPPQAAQGRGAGPARPPADPAGHDRLELRAPRRGEKTLFGRLSVFAGGRTLEAIEEICDPEGDLDALRG